MKTIAVIGAGTMGNGIAHTFAQSGFAVKLIDVSEKSLDKGMATIFANLDRMVTKGTITITSANCRKRDTAGHRDRHRYIAISCRAVAEIAVAVLPPAVHSTRRGERAAGIGTGGNCRK